MHVPRARLGSFTLNQTEPLSYFTSIGVMGVDFRNKDPTGIVAGGEQEKQRLNHLALRVERLSF